MAKTGDNAPMTGVIAPMTGDNVPVTGVIAPKTGDNAPVTGVIAPKTGDNAPMTGVIAPVTGDKGASSYGNVTFLVEDVTDVYSYMDDIQSNIYLNALLAPFSQEVEGKMKQGRDRLKSPEGKVEE